MAEDIYPLGLGGGLLTDALNFALNNIYQYGQRTKESNQRMGAAMGDIAAGKSADFGPLIRDAVSVSPMGAGQITPSAWGAMAPEAKASVNLFSNKFPETFSKLLENNPYFSAQVTNDLPSIAAARLRKGYTRLPMPDLPGSTELAPVHLMQIKPSYADTVPTIGHEIQHSLNESRVNKTNPLDALTIATLLRDFLPGGNRGSLNTLLEKTIEPKNSPGIAGLWQQLASNFGAHSGIGEAPLKVAKGADRNMMKAAMDEALAYLGQNAAQPELTGSMDPMIQKLAERLGVKWR